MMSETAQQDYKYPLTRICLREGQMTLTRRLLEIFPSEGTITLEDSETGETMQAHMSDSRTVKGLGDFYKRYHLNVNDRLLLRKQADILTVAPMRKKRQNDYSSPEAVNHILDYIADNNTPLSEAEIRDIFPDLPITVDLAALLKEDGRFMRGEGRWRLAPTTSPVREAAPIKIDEAVIANPFPFVEEKKVHNDNEAIGNRRPIIKGSEWRKQHHIEAEEVRPAIIDGIDTRLGIALDEDDAAGVHQVLESTDTNHQATIHPIPAEEEVQAMLGAESYVPSSLHSFRLDADAFTPSSHPEQSHPEQSHPEQSHPEQMSHPEQSHPEQTSHPELSQPEASYTDTRYTNGAGTGYTAVDYAALAQSYSRQGEQDVAVHEVIDQYSQPNEQAQAIAGTEMPHASSVSSAMTSEQVVKEAKVEGSLEPNPVIFPGDQGLHSLEPEAQDVAQDMSQRVMWVLSQVGYNLEPIHNLGQEGETQQLLAHAHLGEAQSYSVLIHLHPSQARLDWAGLLAKRRETGADYLCVFGDAEDLQRLHSPAELARATLWSWKGLERLESGNQALPLSPIDLEPYFSRHGMFEYGLEHFQKITEQRISERGHLSAVLRRLATLDAPCVFTLADIQEGSQPPISEEKWLELLYTLSQPPFELVIALDDGSYSLRQPIAQALSALSDYANSLKAHIARQAAKEKPKETSRVDVVATIANDEATLNASRLSA